MSRKTTILCIDDHWNSLIGSKMLLEQNGYRVLEATNGPEGLQLFLSQAVDAVVLDYSMPGMSGGVVAAKMKHINSQVPILLLSAYGAIPPATMESVDSFLAKAQPPNLLLSTLQQLLDHPSRPFFRRWLDSWRIRNQGARP